MIKPIPRAIYYMSPVIALRSFVYNKIKKQQFDLVDKFCNGFANSVNAPYGILTTHARTALYLSLKALDLSEGDEVLMSAVNIPDMINMVRLNGLIPRLFDYDPASLNFSLDDLRYKINKRTKVIFITVLSGIKGNLKLIYDEAKKNNIILIQDLTQAYSASLEKQQLNFYSDISIYSLCDLKDIHTHRGGMIVTHSLKIYKRINQEKDNLGYIEDTRILQHFIIEDLISTILLRRNFFTFFIYPLLILIDLLGFQRILMQLTNGEGIHIGPITIGRGLWGGDGEFIRCDFPDEFRYHFSNIQANIGLFRLLRVKKIISRRIENAILVYNLIDKSLCPFNYSEGDVFWKFPIYVENPKKWQSDLLKYGIDAAPTNLKSFSSITAFAPILKDELHNAQNNMMHILYIPIHYYLSKQECEYIANAINTILRKITK